MVSFLFPLYPNLGSLASSSGVKLIIIIAAILKLLLTECWLYKAAPILSLITMPVIIIFSIVQLGKQLCRAQTLCIILLKILQLRRAQHGIKLSSFHFQTPAPNSTLYSCFLCIKFLVSSRYCGRHNPCMTSLNYYFTLGRWGFPFLVYRWGPEAQRN